MTHIRTVLAGLATTALLFACAIDVGPFFTPPQLPENQPAFNGGQIGLLTPALSKENELIAFRLLSGLKMDRASPTLGGRKAAAPFDAANNPPTGEYAWQQVRAMITDPPAPSFVQTYRQLSTGGQDVFYENCLADAFDTASRTLEDRRAAYHSNEAFQKWVTAQDQVFENCAGSKAVYPDSLPATASALERADREYQIAAAHFYAADFEDAARRFRLISSDASSPWRSIAPYLVARSLLREASLQGNAAALQQARDELMKLAANPNAGPNGDLARRMVEHIDAMEHPETTLESLSAQVSSKQPSGASLEDAIHQSAFVLRATSFQAALSKPGIPETFDWVETLEKSDEKHAVERWRAQKTLPWLVLALMNAAGMDEPTHDLLADADQLPESSPAFGTASYNAVRLRLERGETRQARSALDHLLALTNQPDSLVNGWRAERMRIATSFDDFLRWAPRKPVEALENFGKPNSDSEILAYDSAYVFNNLTSLSKLIHAARSKLVHPWSASDIALAAWTRAFMLNDLDALRELGPLVGRVHSDWLSSLTPDASHADQWRFRAALLIALHHQFQPSVSVDYRPELADSGAWWCPVETTPSTAQNPDGADTIAWRLPVAFTPSKEVLSQEDLDAAHQEIEKLHDLGSTEMFLAPIIFGWAKSHPDDPLTPQALHRLVMVTRFGCRNGNPAIGQISKTAFDLLHKQYPNSTWAAQTPYWFK